MLSLKGKLGADLRITLDNKSYKNYRVIVHCKTMFDDIEKKIKTYKCELIHSLSEINCLSAVLSPSAISKLIEYPQVDHVEFDNMAYLCSKSVLSSNGVAYQEKYRLTGKGVGIGLVDSGVYPHQDLLSPNNKIKKFEDIINHYKYPYDDNGHGTFTAGILCGSGKLSRGLYKGIAENSHIYCVKAFNSLGRAFVSDTLYSIYKLLQESDEYNIKVICLPFELTEFNPFILSLYLKLFEKAYSKNITVVVPSGHMGNTECSITGIATLEKCITVAGVDTSSTIKPYKYSSCGPFGKLEKPDICAASVDISSLNSNLDYVSERNGMKIYPPPLEQPYKSCSGTSCASAYIAGVCALLYENKPDITCRDVLSLLKVSCRLLEMSKWLQGAGFVDLNKLLP